jgi:predicted  nucleic acid-binding Zn-ribbon protein
MKTAISALVALVIGAGGMYFYQQGSVKQLQSAAAALETQMSEAKSAAEAAKGEVTKLQDAGKALEAELADAKAMAEASAADVAKAMEQKVQEATALQAKVAELEAAIAAAKSGTAQ